jgi:hypothetical protein
MTGDISGEGIVAAIVVADQTRAVCERLYAFEVCDEGRKV